MIKIFFSFLLFLPFVLTASGGLDYSSYPVPPKNANTLFYIQRSKNINAIVYEANTTSNGTLNEKEPIKIYWIRYTSDSSMAPLTFIQNKYAYGVNTELFRDEANQYILKFVSYDKRWIYVKRAPDGHYAAYMFINGIYARLSRVFIQLGEGSFWFPSIEYVEIVGKDVNTQQVISEKFVPK